MEKLLMRSIFNLLVYLLLVWVGGGNHCILALCCHPYPSFNSLFVLVKDFAISVLLMKNTWSRRFATMSSFKSKWGNALKHVLPTYLIIHIMFAVLTVFSALFLLNDFSTNTIPL